MNNKNREKIFYISKSGEILFWLLIILFFVSVTSLGLISKEKFDDNDYQIFLQDVDGLIVGSPVRMMGIEVGHVTKIKPVKDEVYVKFVITTPDVYIPQGTRITVEFSGMAGSKSLELYLPQEGNYIDKTTPLITVMPPKRLHDAMGLLNDMFKKIGSIIYTTSDFGSKLQANELCPNNKTTENHNIKNFMNYSDYFLENSNKKVIDIKNSIMRFKNDR